MRYAITVHEHYSSRFTKTISSLNEATMHEREAPGKYIISAPESLEGELWELPSVYAVTPLLKQSSIEK